MLVLDSARFKYPPFFVTVQELWESLLPVDPETGKCRGYFVISADEQQKLDIQKRRLESSLEGLVSQRSAPSTRVDTQVLANDALSKKEDTSSGCDCNCVSRSKS